MNFFFILDLDKPTFNTTSNNVALDEGEYLSITCNSVANPGAQYRWITSAGSLVSSTKTLEFQSLNRVNAKMYTCVANNSAGLEKSSNLTINVQCELFFWIFPYNLINSHNWKFESLILVVFFSLLYFIIKNCIKKTRMQCAG